MNTTPLYNIINARDNVLECFFSNSSLLLDSKIMPSKKEVFLG